MEYHFIYLIKEKQDIDTNEPIFKIGKSTQENTRRVKSYPSGSHLLLQVACDNCHSMETFLIQEFKRRFTLARGREYFRGDVLKMKELIFRYCTSENIASVHPRISTDGSIRRAELGQRSGEKRVTAAVREAAQQKETEYKQNRTKKDILYTELRKEQNADTILGFFIYLTAAYLMYDIIHQIYIMSLTQSQTGYY
jgi:hypothetical protein